MKKMAIIIISLVTLLLMILVPIFLDNSVFYLENGDVNSTNLALYLVSKILLGVIFLGVVAYLLFKKPAQTMTATLLGISVIFQIIPLLVRYICVWDFQKELISSIVLVLAVGVYGILLVGSFAANKKMVESEEKFQGAEIPLQNSEDVISAIKASNKGE